MDCQPPSVAGEASLPCSHIPVGCELGGAAGAKPDPVMAFPAGCSGRWDVHPRCETPGLAEQPRQVAQTWWGGLLIFHLLKSTAEIK